MRLSVAVVLVVSTVTLSPNIAAAQSGASREQIDDDELPPLEWKSEWDRFQWWEGAAAGGMVLGIGALMFLPAEEGGEGNWRSQFFLDEGVRDGMRLEGDGARATAATASDALLLTMMAMPVVDIGWAMQRGGTDVAMQMAAIDVSSFALTTLVTMGLKQLFGRERPWGRGCEEGAVDGNCDGPDRYQSFLSGHTAIAFTGAGLTCVHHENLDLYGSSTADSAACVGALGAATAAGALRMLADRHYFTDVVAGAALGLVSGYVIPKLLHYGIGGDDEDDEPADERGQARASLSPFAGSDQIGLSISGTF